MRSKAFLETMTSRDFLEIAFPTHDMHTVVEFIEASARGVELVCSCNPEPLKISVETLKLLGLTLRDAKHALRNVPVPPV